jgi:zinc protease
MLMSRQSLLLILLTAVLLTAQLSCARLGALGGKPAPSPTPGQRAAIDKILERYEEALGGSEAIAEITSYKIKGTWELQGMRGKIEGWQKEPQKRLSVIEFPGIGTLKRGFDGETYWVQTPAGTFTDENPQEIAEMERDAEVYSAAKIKNQFETMKLENKARLSGRDMNVIEGKPAKGPAEKLFFDAENGLLVRWDMARRHPKRGIIFAKAHLENYQQIGKVKVPFKIRFAYESFTFTVFLDEVQHNVKIDDAIFKKPR